ncbi:TIGR03751 family conjugal transfer lipoprotein [Pseudomonas fluorescens]|nr:TIGR03751 family conjugal transfer lipoprotein [Pseudomonas fluorescens]
MSRRSWINGLSIAMLLVWLTGCSTSSEELLSHNGNTMLEVWSQQGNPSVRQLSEARLALRRPLPVSNTSIASYTRTAQSEIYQQFKRLPNPDMRMFVFPHLAGSDPVPVPGYSTVFPFYQRVQYALPGERLDDY